MMDPYEFEMDPDDFVDDSGLPTEDDVNVNMVKKFSFHQSLRAAYRLVFIPLL